ncbi:hypothetical protein HELRODRAFT_183670 [Helobdella robusta]|uniref:Uncharacterized protein n=1 Tax=Helobdella robusta TaxID=6412 RepID=T1FK07_HELRO|nr:hypothetical protein HELRODRAFT_183670 [Helobdella robusta]ESO10393.1 hypothetical protein HELRODRAFT_183670 [Helobdella robusta]
MSKSTSNNRAKLASTSSNDVKSKKTTSSNNFSNGKVAGNKNINNIKTTSNNNNLKNNNNNNINNNNNNANKVNISQSISMNCVQNDSKKENCTVGDCLNWPTSTNKTPKTTTANGKKCDRIVFENADVGSGHKSLKNDDDNDCSLISSKMENLFLDDDDDEKIIYYSNDNNTDDSKTNSNNKLKLSTKPATKTRNGSINRSRLKTKPTLKTTQDPRMEDLISHRFHRESKQERERIESEKAALKKQTDAEMASLLRKKANQKSNKTSQLRSIAISKNLDFSVGSRSGDDSGSEWKMSRFKNATSKISTVNALKNETRTSKERNGFQKTEQKKTDKRSHKDEEIENETITGHGYKDELGFSNFVDDPDNDIDDILKQACKGNDGDNGDDVIVNSNKNKFIFFNDDDDNDNYAADNSGDEFSPPSGHPYTSRGGRGGSEVEAGLHESSAYEAFNKPGLFQI